VERCHVEALREEARRRRAAMGRRSVWVYHRTTDDEGRPLILWWRRGETKRRLTGWDDGHVWTVEVPARLRTAKEALEWLQPEGVDEDTPRQGEWYFLPADGHVAHMCDLAEERGHADYEEPPTEAGSWHRTLYKAGEWVRTRHRAECVVVAIKHGEVVSYGSKGRLRAHKYSSRPRLYVRGRITAPNHADLVLEGWHEVIGNRAVGAPAAIAVGLD
jgi:hypothetical protein